MSEMEVQEGNKLIAEFLGFKRNDAYSGDMARFKHWNIEPFGWFDDEGLRYHTSWNWLKPVIDKVYEYSLAHPEQAERIRDMSIVVEIGAAWERVVNFIQWYNTLTTPTEGDKK